MMIGLIDSVFKKQPKTKKIECCICGKTHIWIETGNSVDNNGWGVVYHKNKIISAICPDCEI